MVALAAPQNAAVLPGAWLYNGDQSRKPYYAIEEVSKNLISYDLRNDLAYIGILD